MFHFL